MREILFRGKRVDNGEWIKGLIKVHLVDGDIKQKERKYFITVQWMDKIGKVYRYDHEVIPETVGQYNGFEDSKGIKIFEGDIVGCVHTSDDIYTDMVLVEDIKNIPSELFGSSLTSRVVVGNIYDNAYLMRGDQ